jgi:hypothetical protein
MVPMASSLARQYQGDSSGPVRVRMITMPNIVAKLKNKDMYISERRGQIG